MAIQANSTRMSRGHRPLLIYTAEEAEKIARRLPLERRYGPLEAAHAAAQYLDPDPAFWLQQAALAGIETELEGERLCFRSDEDAMPEFDFFVRWLRKGKGGKPLKRLLEKRRAEADRRVAR